MVSIILIFWSVAMLYAGFKLGARFKTIAEFKKHVGSKINQYLSK